MLFVGKQRCTKGEASTNPMCILVFEKGERSIEDIRLIKKKKLKILGCLRNDDGHTDCLVYGNSV